jgi:hypothetical protein
MDLKLPTLMDLHAMVHAGPAVDKMASSATSGSGGAGGSELGELVEAAETKTERE